MYKIRSVYLVTCASSEFLHQRSLELREFSSSACYSTRIIGGCLPPQPMKYLKASSALDVGAFWCLYVYCETLPFMRSVNVYVDGQCRKDRCKAIFTVNDKLNIIPITLNRTLHILSFKQFKYILARTLGFYQFVPITYLERPVQRGSGVLWGSRPHRHPQQEGRHRVEGARDARHLYPA